MKSAIAPERIDQRCRCGKLLARISLEGVEILCRHSKRVHRIPWDAVQLAEATPAAGAVQPGADSAPGRW